MNAFTLQVYYAIRYSPWQWLVQEGSKDELLLWSSPRWGKQRVPVASMNRIESLHMNKFLTLLDLKKIKIETDLNSHLSHSRKTPKRFKHKV